MARDGRGAQRHLLRLLPRPPLVVLRAAGEAMPERIAFDPRKLAGDTHSLLYSILQPHQRKAVVRESFALFFINNKGEHKKIVDKSGNMLVETHRRAA